MKGKLIFTLTALAAAILVALFVFEKRAEATTQVTICHNSGQSGSYQKITVDWNSVDGQGNGDHNSSNHQNGRDIIPPGFWDNNGRNWDTQGQAIWNNNCNVPQPTPTPTVVPTATPTPTQTPKEECGEGYVEVENECVPVPTPTREPEPTPRPEPGPASAPEQPACKDIRYAPTITGVGRLDSDSIWVEWTKVEDYVNRYLVWYGPSKDLLIWNTFVDGERAEIHNLWPNTHTWVKVAGTHEGCVGNFSAVVDP